MRPIKYLRKNLHVIAFDLRERFNDIIAFARGKDSSVIFEQDGTKTKPQSQARVAIVAARPTETSSFSLLNLLNSLDDNGFFVLLVAPQQLSNTERQLLLPRCDHIIERHNVGRDFGSYKAGLRWLAAKGMVASSELLCFANDSLFYPNSFGRQLTEFISTDESWYALFENFEKHYHAQSFFQIFSREITSSRHFEGFWEAYKPLSSREHAIDAGEVGLSRALISGGFHPSVLYSVGRVCADVLALLSKKPWNRDLILSLKQTMGQSFFSIMKENITSHTIETALPTIQGNESLLPFVASDLVHSLAHHVEHRNPTHSVGLLCNVLYEAPIKRDMVYRGAIHLGTLLTHCRGFTDDEKVWIAADLKLKGLPQSLDYSRRLRSLYNAGRI